MRECFSPNLKSSWVKESHPFRISSSIPVRSRARDLTRRQRDVLALLAQGLSNRKIAETLNIRETTVKVHVHAILEALGVANRTQAVVVGASKGLCALGQAVN